MVSRFSRWPPRWPSSIAAQYDFSNSESLSRSDASHQVSTKSNLRFGRRCHRKNFKMVAWQPSWISERNDFSNFESLCRSYAFHQVSAQSDLQFRRRYRLKNFKVLGYWKGTILAILNLYVTQMPPITFRLNLINGLGGNVVWRISRWPPWWPTWISEWKDFISSEFLCHCDASHQDSAQSDAWFGRRYRLKNFKIAVMAAILDIGTE